MIQVRRLTEHEERMLQEIAVARHTSELQKLRARVVLLSNQRWTVPKIAANLGLHHHSVRARIRRFNELGLRGLRDLPRPGRPRVYGADEREWVRVLAATDPANLGLPLRTWTLSALQRHLAELGVAPNMGRETIRRILLSEPADTSHLPPMS